VRRRFLFHCYRYPYKEATVKEYKEYQQKLDEVEKQENQSGDAAEQFIPAGFVILFAVLSGAATFYLNEAGMRNSPLYNKTIGGENAAFLVLGILEGSLLMLTLLGHKILKSKPQRSIGKAAIVVLEGILSLNLLVAFVMLAGYGTRIMPGIQTYAQWGVPFTVIGAGWLWIYIVTHRRKTMMRNQMLDDAADVERLWAEQHRLDQQRYRDAYRQMSASPEMERMRQEIAAAQAVEQIAQESQISIAEAEELYARLQGGKGGQLPSGKGPARLPGP
jgi:hypothetical protein